MKRTFSQIWALFTQAEKRRAVIMLLLVILMAAAETLSIDDVIDRTNLEATSRAIAARSLALDGGLNPRGPCLVTYDYLRAA